MADLPPNKKLNGFTGEIEDAPPLNLAPSPADQRILAAPPHTDPLPVLCDRVVQSIGNDDAGIDVEAHVGPSLTEDSLPGETPLPYVPQRDTPALNDVEPTPVQHIDVPPANAVALDEGAQQTTEGVNYPGLDTKAFNDSIDARNEAEALGTPIDKLPEIEPPVPGDQLNKETAVSDTPETPDETPDETPAAPQEEAPATPEEGDGVPVSNPDEIPPAEDTSPQGA